MALKTKPHTDFLPPEQLVDSIRNGDKVTIQIPNGIGRHGQEWKEATGRAVMRGPVGWVLNMGGRYGTPGVACVQNIVSVRKRKEQIPNVEEIKT